ncbi:MAG: YciI family protein [Lapillicoccus sp.]
MKYVVLLYGDETVWHDLDTEGREEAMGGHAAFAAAVSEHATVLAGEGLDDTPSASTVRHDANGEMLVTEGPFAETTEQLGGFYLVEIADRDTLTSLCALLPHWYAVEIRPVADV